MNDAGIVDQDIDAAMRGKRRLDAAPRLRAALGDICRCTKRTSPAAASSPPPFRRGCGRHRPRRRWRPRRAERSAMAWPMPAADPLTIAVLPSSLIFGDLPVAPADACAGAVTASSAISASVEFSRRCRAPPMPRKSHRGSPGHRSSPAAGPGLLRRRSSAWWRAGSCPSASWASRLMAITVFSAATAPMRSRTSWMISALDLLGLPGNAGVEHDEAAAAPGP